MIFHQALDYQHLEERYHAMQQLPGFVLLRSHPQSGGRYDIVSALPHQTCLDSDCDAWMLQWPLVDNASSWPFVGGVIGWVSYELCLEWHGIEKAYRRLLEGLPLLELRYFFGGIIVDHHQKTAHLVWNDSLGEPVEKWCKSLEQQWNQPIQNQGCDNTHVFKTLTTPSEYQHAIATIQNHIADGRVYQVNYTQAFIHSAFYGSSWEWFWQTQKKNPVPYAGYWQHPDYQIMSFSPECFLTIDGQTAITQPIKGTIARGDTPEQDQQNKTWLQHSEKNLAENIMIVDLLRNDFGKLSLTGSVDVPFYCQLQTFKNVHHLVSEVRSQLQTNTHPWLFAKACMPGGSITGAPKHEAMKVISELEPYQRQAYCGHLFYLSAHGRWDSNILIRTVTQQQQQLLAAAGGGIVIDSNANEEYQESFAKIKTIINATLHQA